MAEHCSSDKEWAEGVIENCKTGDPASAAIYCMVKYCGSSQKWADSAINPVEPGILCRERRRKVRMPRRSQ